MQRLFSKHAKIERHHEGMNYEDRDTLLGFLAAILTVAIIIILCLYGS